MTAYQFLALKIFRIQHWSNNIVETTQLTNDQTLEFNWHCECWKCPPTAPSSNTSFQSLNL